MTVEACGMQPVHCGQVQLSLGVREPCGFIGTFPITLEILRQETREGEEEAEEEGTLVGGPLRKACV